MLLLVVPAYRGIVIGCIPSLKDAASLERACKACRGCMDEFLRSKCETWDRRVVDAVWHRALRGPAPAATLLVFVRAAAQTPQERTAKLIDALGSRRDLPDAQVASVLDGCDHAYDDSALLVALASQGLRGACARLLRDGADPRARRLVSLF